MKTALYPQKYSYLCVPYNSYNKAAIIFLDSIYLQLFHMQANCVRLEALTESLYPHTKHIKCNLHQLHKGSPSVVFHNKMLI